MVMENLRTVFDQTKKLTTEVTALKNFMHELKAEVFQNSKFTGAIKICEDAVKLELASMKGELATSHVEFANFRWCCHEIASRTKQAECVTIEMSKVVLICSVSVCAQMYSNMQGELEKAF